MTGARRRREWSDDEKLAIIAESFSTATSTSAVARRYGINKNQLFQWRRQFREGAFERDEAPPVEFVPMVTDNAEEGERHSAAVAVSPVVVAVEPAMIEIVVGAMTVRVPASADEALLRRVFGAAKALA